MKKDQIDVKPTRQEKAEETRGRILDVASELFLKGDFAHVTTDDIAEKAEVSKGTVFHHFDSKDKLVTEVIHRFMNTAFGELEGFKESSMTREEFVSSLVGFSLTIGVQMPGLTQLLMQLAMRFDYFHPEETPEHIEELIEEIFVDWIARFAEAFHHFGFDNPKMKARIFFALLDGLAIQLYLSRRTKEDPIVDELTKEVVKLFLR